MRQNKPLPTESSFKEFSENKSSGAHKSNSNFKKKNSSKPGFKKDFNRRDSSRGNSRGFSNDGRKSFDRNKSSGKDREMFDAVCSKCKKPCKVPFKPTTGKPIYCSDCFVKKDSPRRNNFGGNSRGFSNGGRKSFDRNRDSNRGRR